MTGNGPEQHDDDPLEAMLEGVGSAPTPSPEPMFVARLETNLRHQHAARPGASGRLWWPVIAGAGALAGIIAVVLFAAGPDRTQLEGDAGVAGQPVPSETLVPVPPETVASVPIDTDDAVTTTSRPGQQVESNNTTSTAAPKPATGSDTSIPTGGPSTTTPSRSTTTAGPDRPTTTVDADRTSTTSGPRTTTTEPGPRPTSSTPPPDTTTTTTSSSTTTTTRPATVALELEVTRVEGGIEATWTRLRRDDFARWRLTVRTETDDGVRTATIFESERQLDRTTTQRLAAGRHQFRIRAFDGQGRVIAESRWVVAESQADR